MFADQQHTGNFNFIASRVLSKFERQGYMTVACVATKYVSVGVQANFISVPLSHNKILFNIK